MRNRLKNRAALGVLGLLSVLLSLFLWGLPSAALAQEDSSQEFQVQAGAYRITVIADPSRLSLGTVLYTITVVDSENAQPVSDARVTINTRSEVEDIVGWAAALHRPSNPGTYEATVQLDAGSTWRSSVEVSSSLGRVEVEVPPLTIPQPRQTRSGSLVFLGVFLAILLGVAYLVWSSRKAIKAREAASEN
jgi:cytoskeletal protein RodZ